MEIAGALASSSPFGGHRGFLDRGSGANVRGGWLISVHIMTNTISDIVAWRKFIVNMKCTYCER